MTDQNIKIRLEPLGSENFSIIFIDEATKIVKRSLGGEHGYAEADLRSPTGLSACGLTEAQIDAVITLANDKRLR